MPDAKLEGALVECRKMIQVGSKSFSLAAKLFDPRSRDAAFFLYGWCRYCDDQIDQSGTEKEAKLKALIEETHAAYRGTPSDHPVFIAFAEIVRKYQIPEHYPVELLEGMAMDVRNEYYPTISALKLYCYRVAGTVGLMMSHIMGLSDERALKNACDLGMAMQLTNIARDVMEDAAMGRVYLPLDWLKEVQVKPAQVGMVENRRLVSEVVRKLLDEADGYYRSGLSGLQYLPMRSAFAVSSAGFVYSEIGHQVRKRGENAWLDRSIVSFPRKIWLLTRGVASVVWTLPARIRNPWSPASIKQVWRYSS